MRKLTQIAAPVLLGLGGFIVVLTWMAGQSLGWGLLKAQPAHRGMLMVEAGHLAGVGATYRNYQVVNVRRADGSAAGRNRDLELLMAEVLELERLRDSGGEIDLLSRHNRWLTQELLKYMAQDRLSMRKILLDAPPK